MLNSNVGLRSVVVQERWSHAWVGARCGNKWRGKRASGVGFSARKQCGSTDTLREGRSRTAGKTACWRKVLRELSRLDHNNGG